MGFLTNKIFIAKAPWADLYGEASWYKKIKELGFDTVVIDRIPQSWMGSADNPVEWYQRTNINNHKMGPYVWLKSVMGTAEANGFKVILDLSWFLDWLVETKPEEASGSIYNGSQSFTQYQQLAKALRDSGILDLTALLYVRIKSTPEQPKWGNQYHYPTSSQALAGFFYNVAGQLKMKTPGGKNVMVSYGAFHHLDGNGGITPSEMASALRNDVFEVNIQHQWDYDKIPEMVELAKTNNKDFVIAYNDIEEVGPDSSASYFNIVKSPQERADKILEWAPTFAQEGVMGYGTGLVNGGSNQYAWNPDQPGWDALKRFSGYFLRGESLNPVQPPTNQPQDSGSEEAPKRIVGTIYDPEGRGYVSSIWSDSEYHDGGTKENGILIEGTYTCEDGEVRVSSVNSDKRRWATRMSASRKVYRRSRAVWLTTMYGVGDQSRWTKDPKSVGFDMVRITDIIERDAADLKNDPEKKFDEVRAKLDAYLKADIAVLLDFSFVRNLAERALTEDKNVYDEPSTIELYESAIKLCKDAGVWNHPAIHVVAIAGEPDAPNWGKTKRHPKSHDALMGFYERVSYTLRTHGYMGPITSGGVMHFDGGSGLDFAKLAAEPWNDIVTVHIYNKSDVDYLPKAAAICRNLGKPFWVEEFGVKVVPSGDLEFAQVKNDKDRSALFEEWFKLFADLEIEGIGLWNLGDGDGHSVQIGRDNDSIEVMRDWIIRTGKF